tara:strand:+ start:1867 stop:2235 length:369 start_codon:yes stop_codon:yes gene_type:complete
MKTKLNNNEKLSTEQEATPIANVLLVAVNYLYLMAGISEPTEEDNYWAMEAIVYANPDYWVDKPMTHKEYADRKMFEIKSLSYFMRKRNYNDLEAVRYFEEYEHRELTNLRAVTSHPAFNCD